MKLQNIFLLFLSILAVSCASTRPKDATNYDKQLIAPEFINEYVLGSKEIFNEPSSGAMLRYENRDFPEDNITVYVYPINAVSWKDKNETMQDELTYALTDLDTAIQYGYYQSRTKELVSDFSFKSEGKDFNGKKAEFSLTAENDIVLYSDIYIFIDEDKYIKFRTSFDSRSVNRSMGDEVIQTLLPKLKVPPESIYMKRIRDDHKKKIQQDFIRLMQQVLEESKE
jgi:hypothetical protein